MARPLRIECLDAYYHKPPGVMSGRIFSKPGERPRAIYVIDIRGNVLKDIGKYFKVTDQGFRRQVTVLQWP